MTHVSSIVAVWLFVTVVVSTCWSPAAAQSSTQDAPFRPEEIEQLVAPIALYPDPLLAQILMGSEISAEASPLVVSTFAPQW